MRGGRYLEYPYWGKDGHREIGNLYTTFLHAVGESRPYFGLHDTLLKGEASGDGPLPELPTISGSLELIIWCNARTPS